MTLIGWLMELLDHDTEDDDQVTKTGHLDDDDDDLTADESDDEELDP